VVLCSPVGVDYSWVGGEPLVQEGAVAGVDEGLLVERHNMLARDLVG
jgi:hypothetical protein